MSISARPSLRGQQDSSGFAFYKVFVRRAAGKKTPNSGACAGVSTSPCGAPPRSVLLSFSRPWPDVTRLPAQSQPSSHNLGHEIGIGDGLHRPFPCHTTRHAGPHRAVREIEVRSGGVTPSGRTKRCSARDSVPDSCYATSGGRSSLLSVPFPRWHPVLAAPCRSSCRASSV